MKRIGIESLTREYSMEADGRKVLKIIIEHLKSKYGISFLDSVEDLEQEGEGELSIRGKYTLPGEKRKRSVKLKWAERYREGVCQYGPEIRPFWSSYEFSTLDELDTLIAKYTKLKPA